MSILHVPKKCSGLIATIHKFLRFGQETLNTSKDGNMLGVTQFPYTFSLMFNKLCRNRDAAMRIPFLLEHDIAFS